MKTKSKFYRLNQYILAPTVRLIDALGKQIGIVSRQEALARAEQEEVDLVEVAPNTNPPVCRLIDFKKFKYLESKKEKATKKQTGGEVKEIRMGPFIDDHDFNVRVERGKEFLKESNKIRVVVKFSGRQMAHPEFGKEVMARFINTLGELIKIEREPHFEGRLLVALLAPSKKGKG